MAASEVAVVPTEANTIVNANDDKNDILKEITVEKISTKDSSDANSVIADHGKCHILVWLNC